MAKGSSLLLAIPHAYTEPDVHIGVLVVAAVATSAVAYVAGHRLSRAGSMLTLAILLAPSIPLLVPPWLVFSDVPWLYSDRLIWEGGFLVSLFWIATVSLGWTIGSQTKTGIATPVRWFFVAILATAVVVSAAFPDFLAGYVRDRSHWFQERDQLRSNEKSARRCIAEVQARDPEADADADWQRGDVTPLGITYASSEGDYSTAYPTACGLKVYEGEYRPTGKWLLPRQRSRSNVPWTPPPSLDLCFDAEHNYISQYNSRMMKRAADRIHRFCSEQKVEK